MGYILSSADFLYKTYIKFTDQVSSGAKREYETNKRAVFYRILHGIIFIWFSSICILVVGTNHLLYYLLCVPPFLATLCLLLSLCFIKDKTSLTLKTYHWIIVFVCCIGMLLSAYLFTNGSINIENQGVIIHLDLNILILGLEILLMLVPIFITRKQLKIRDNR